MSKGPKYGKAAIGAAMMGLGGLLASPADEVIVTAATGGAGAVAAPVQAPATGALGLALVAGGGWIFWQGLKGK